MRLIINGKEQEIDTEEVSINQILKICKVESPDMVSVQLNRKLIRKEEYASVFPNENDEIDFLYFMGGGLNISSSGSIQY